MGGCSPRRRSARETTDRTRHGGYPPCSSSAPWEWYSAFTVRDPTTDERRRTGLDAILRRLAVRRLAIVGLATDYCVRETALEALGHGFDVIVVREGVRAVNLDPRDGERALEEIAARGGQIADLASVA